MFFISYSMHSSMPHGARHQSFWRCRAHQEGMRRSVDLMVMENKEKDICVLSVGVQITISLLFNIKDSVAVHGGIQEFTGISGHVI